MSVIVRLATNNIVGVTGLTAAQVVGDSSPEPNTVLAVTGTLAQTITLPKPGANEDFAGSVIIIKNLKGEDNDTEITISREGDVLIDGLAEDVIMDTHEQTISFYYVNTDIGWLSGPAQV